MKQRAAHLGLVSPAILDVTNARDVPDEEHFGPMVQVTRYKRFDEAIERANDTAYGLSAGLLADDEAAWTHFQRTIRAGIVNWNRPTNGASSAAPFGGIGTLGQPAAERVLRGGLLLVSDGVGGKRAVADARERIARPQILRTREGFMMQAFEANFDGLVGPTHNYAGLSFGNVASRNNEKSVANPKAAAKQGLRKMKQLADLGFHQGVLPPLERPSLKLLRELGFTGTDASVIERAAREAPELLAAASSASAMWTANAATVSPSADTSDERVHFTPANLASKLHRAIEHGETRRSLSAIFADEARFRIHHALPGTPALGDEGAANHTRFCREYGAKGVEFFVYGRSEYGPGPQPKRFPARQTLEASRAVARLHGLSERSTVFAQQLPDVIDAGVFHNDVIAVGNRTTLVLPSARVPRPAEGLRRTAHEARRARREVHRDRSAGGRGERRRTRSRRICSTASC